MDMAAVDGKYAALAAKLQELHGSLGKLDASISSAARVHEHAVDVSVVLGSFLSTNPGEFVACAPVLTASQAGNLAVAGGAPPRSQ